MTRAIVLVGLATAALGLGCASRQPVLYPNTHLENVGSAEAQRDIEACRTAAAEAVRGGKVTEVAKRTGEDAVVGGATGAAVGAIVRNTSAGRGAAAGAAAGAVRTAVREGIRWNDPDPVERAWVDRCLRDRGYDVIGWR